MQDCATNEMRFETQAALTLEAAFDGGRITSDGGLLWLAEVDSQMGLCEAISECVPEWRTRKGRHSLLSLIRQRVFQIACGYEDQNDSDFLREDPLLKLSCGSLPESGSDLASQPTICRMENAATRRSCRQIAEVLFEIYLNERGKDGAPQKVLLDFDATADPVHGEQEDSYYHGYYGQHIYHPLVVFDGESGHLITALLRAGNTHSSNSSVALLKRIVCRLRERWPEVQIELRADAGFAVAALYDYCEQKGITYTIALITNPKLQQMAEVLLEEAKESHQKTSHKARLFGEELYEAGSWQHERRVIYKAEAMEQGTNTRFVLTTRNDEPNALYEFYARRGEAENWIKDLKLHMKADRLSCHRFVANQFRLLLHAAAYWFILPPSAQPPITWGTGVLSIVFVFMVPFLAFPLVGALIASRRPHNPIGWICLAVGLFWMLNIMSGGYGIYGLLASPGSVPFPAAIGSQGEWIGPATVGLLGTYLILLFPDGRLPSTRWRPLAWLSGTVLALGTVANALAPGPLPDLGGVRNPFGLEGYPWMPGPGMP